jgi:hypothetical protein
LYVSSLLKFRAAYWCLRDFYKDWAIGKPQAISKISGAS